MIEMLLQHGFDKEMDWLTARFLTKSILKLFPGEGGGEADQSMEEKFQHNVHTTSVNRT